MEYEAMEVKRTERENVSSLEPQQQQTRRKPAETIARYVAYFKYLILYYMIWYCRGGAGISRVVRPLQIKDHSCMCKGRGGVSTTGNVRQ